MSVDFVALARRRPDVFAIADGLAAMGEPIHIRGGENEPPTRLFDAAGRLLVSIEEPVEVTVASEIARLLGDAFAARVGAPVWWVDVRAVADVPEAARVARRFSDALVHWVGGTVYPEGESDAPAQSWRAENASPDGTPAPGVIGGY
ncbi:hypothetical protein AB0J52_30170 [Spirillospora sp. NPDC049652]